MKKTFCFPAHMNEIENAQIILQQILIDANIDKEKQGTAYIIVDEIFSNIAKYAYPEQNGNLFLQIYISIRKEVTLVFMDGGISYNPLLKKELDVCLSLQERQIGGLGLYIVRKLARHVSYQRQGQKNILKVKL